MKTKALTATQIDTLAQRLSETPIEPSASAKKAEARLALVLDYGNTEPTVDAIPKPIDEPKAVTAPAIGKRQAIRDQAQTGALPPVPDFSKPTHARFRAKLAQIVALAEAGDMSR